MLKVPPLLETILSPADLRKLSGRDLPRLADELRQYYFQLMNEIGGHFGASLGTVELTIALHYVFNTPYDRLVWDVGHQAHFHKILTGRRDAMPSIRKYGGLAPFPKRGESQFDTFGVGHSSTSISAALGMCLGKNPQDDYKTIAVIGDGAMTAGMAFEALNHAGAEDADMLVVLNDNDMSISENVGALSNYFARILSGNVYTTMREGSKKVLNVMPPMKELALRAEIHMKGMILPGTLFEELGFHYNGPIDGHNLPLLVKTLKTLSKLKGPRLLHVVTQKGKGYELAEKDPIKYHAVSAGYLDKDKAESPVTKSSSVKKPTYSDVFGDWICDMAATAPDLVAITPAMREGSGLVRYSQEYPDRYFDVGIAEQHAVTFAAGLACEGKKPVVAIYSTFLQRAYDQLIHDVALQNLPVMFAIDRAGLVGADGPTHHGSFDLSYLSAIPNMVIMAPADEAECRDMLTTGFYHEGPVAVRYPRGMGPGKSLDNSLNTLPLGKADIRRQGRAKAILSFGHMLDTAMAAGERLNATVVNMRFIKPLDEALIAQLAQSHTLLVTLEDNAKIGGAGSSVSALVVAKYPGCSVINLGLPDQFIEHGDTSILLQKAGLDLDSICKTINNHERTVHINNEH